MTSDVTAVLAGMGIFTTMFCSILLFGTYLLLSRDTVKIPLILDRLRIIEQHLGSQGDTSEEHWSTSDNRYHANSFDELLLQMIHDPNTPLSPEQVAAIKSIFEDHLGGNDGDDEPWNRS